MLLVVRVIDALFFLHLSRTNFSTVTTVTTSLPVSSSCHTSTSFKFLIRLLACYPTQLTLFSPSLTQKNGTYVHIILSTMNSDHAFERLVYLRQLLRRLHLSLWPNGHLPQPPRL